MNKEHSFGWLNLFNDFIISLKKPAILLWVSGTVTLLLILISFLIDIPYKDIIASFNNDDYFWFDGR